MDRSAAVVLVVALAWSSVAPADDPPKPVAIGSLHATPPAEWKSEKPANRLRSAQFRLPSGEDGVPDAEVIVMPQSSPKAEDYFPRWKTQFVPPEGKGIDDVAKVSKFDVGKATVHVLDVTGTWKHRDRPFDPKSKEELRPDYRVLWAVVVEKDEGTHVRLSGPEKVVAKYQKGFDEWLKGMK